MRAHPTPDRPQSKAPATSAAERSLPPRPDIPPPPPAKKNYVLKNAMIFANMFQHVGSYTDCCARCTNHPTCGGWEYNSNGVCILKSGKPVLVKTEKQMLQNGYFTYAGERASAASARRCSR